MLAAAFLALAAQPQSLVAEWEARVRQKSDAANWRHLSDAYVAARQFDKASNAFMICSQKFAALGDPNAAKILADYSKRYKTEVQPFCERPADRLALARNTTQAKWEPMYGCYLGAFIDREDEIRPWFMANDQIYRDPQYFDNAVQKKHAIYFTYVSYGRQFPSKWCDVLRRRHAAAHIAFEPSNLDRVQDDEYLREFARDARRSGIPVFLRYASEMNGNWTPYTGNPSRYIEKFKLVAKVMREEAPNVAMVWCPAEIPEYNIDSYFPGDDGVDWVGVNFYSVIYNDGDRARSAEYRNPTDALDTLYRRYAAKHPIMVGEWGATHRSVVDNRERSDFAIDKIGQFFAGLPRRYPRVKAVHWLSMDTIRHADGPRKLNDFSLLDNEAVMRKYEEAIFPSYYLSNVELGLTAPVQLVPLTDGATLTDGACLSAHVRTYEQRPTVLWKLDGKIASRLGEPGTYAFRLDAKPGRHIVEIVVVDSKGRVAGRTHNTVLVRS